MRFATNPARWEDREALTEELVFALGTLCRADFLGAAKRASIPAGPVNTVGEALSDPQVQFREMRIVPEGVPGLRTHFMFSRSELALKKALPKKPD